jgi:hypothetical protein
VIRKTYRKRIPVYVQPRPPFPVFLLLLLLAITAGIVAVVR